jgi:hypothetical protein
MKSVKKAHVTAVITAAAAMAYYYYYAVPLRA